MALIRWEPARELQTIQQEMNRLFGTFFEGQEGAPGGGAPVRRWIPAMDLVEDAGHYVLKADLPGVKEDDVSIELEDNVLTVSGERRSEHEESRDGFRRIERASGRFARTLTLPEGVEADAIEASYDNGVLEIRIPKPEQPRPRKVEISVGRREPAIAGTATAPAGNGAAA